MTEQSWLTFNMLTGLGTTQNGKKKNNNKIKKIQKAQSRGRGEAVRRRGKKM